MLQKEVTTHVSTVILLNLLDMVSKVWRAVNGNCALLLFLPPPFSLSPSLNSFFFRLLLTSQSFWKSRIYSWETPLKKAEGQGMLEVLRMNICTPYTSVHMPSIPALALCIVWHNLSIMDIARFQYDHAAFTANNFKVLSACLDTYWIIILETPVLCLFIKILLNLWLKFRQCRGFPPFYMLLLIWTYSVPMHPYHVAVTEELASPFCRCKTEVKNDSG